MSENIDNLAVHIGAKIVEQRRKLRREAAEFAEALGVSVAQLSEWETGQQRIPPAILAKIIGELGCNLSALFGDLSEATRQREYSRLRLVGVNDPDLLGE